jgi:tetraacyldisaccharide 4'-kinase
MKILKPKFWQNKLNFFSIILLPFTLLYMVLIKIRKSFSIQKKFKIPLICVGNIYIGGTGKTPLAIKIKNELENFKKTVVVRKYYKNHKDEHRLIKEKTNSLILNSSRSAAIKEAEINNYDAVILDDGFQDYSIKKDLNILCFNSNQLIGNGLLFPSGPLREGMSSIRDAKIIIINGKTNKEFEKKIFEISNNTNIYYSKYLPLNTSQFKGKKILAIAGIGNPDNFFETLKENHLDIQKTISFPDHYEFKKEELEKIIEEARQNNWEIVTTEKDYYRINILGFKNIKYLEIELKILDKEKLISQILRYI